MMAARGRTPSRAALGLLVLLSLTSRAALAQDQCYPNASPFVRDAIRTSAQGLAANQLPPSGVSDKLAIFAVLDRLGGLEGIGDPGFIAETARTDKQIGGSARAEGSTAAVEKPGFARLLAIAVESGVLQQSTADNRLTLSTSLYSLAAALHGDSAETYRRSDLLTRIGISAGFDLTAGEENPLGSASADQLRDWSLRVRLTPDRTGRSRAFETWWIERIRPLIQENAAAITLAQRTLLTKDTGLGAAASNLLDELDAKIEGARAGGEAAVASLLECGLDRFIVRPLDDGAFQVSDALLTQVRQVLIPKLAATTLARRGARQLLEEYFEQAEGKPHATLTYTQHRPADGQTYSEASLLFEQEALSPVKFVFNAGVSLYHEPDPTKHQQRVRDISVAGSLEGSTPSPFLRGTTDLSRIVVSLSARYQRMRENGGALQELPDVKVVQVKLDLPVAMGVSLPISFSVANDARLIEEKTTWRRGMHFGLTFDADKFYALVRSPFSR